MPRSTIFSNLAGYAEYDAERKIMYIQYSGVMHVDSAKELLMKAAKHGREHGVVGQINNALEFDFSDYRMNQFVLEETLPLLLEGGLRKYCLVGKREPSILKVVEQAQQSKPSGVPVELAFMDSVAKAEQWILSQ